PDFLQGLLRVCPLKALQFHGEESPEEVLAFKGQARLIKAIQVDSRQSLEAIPRYQGVDAVLLEPPPADRHLAAEARRYGIPVIIAGGLDPKNLPEIIREIQPYGVDVSSGVETSPGKKDPALVREFVLRAKSAL
ncbi:MAG: N-(5'-phosphoribosyl)anthranilate isomerase, partial [Candidatus Omnitrophica bacterium]|nr:N-(5'-phosphoribosyl)anthranilate isomerase [Candidatus Omnitrophota bacterium]